MNAKVSITVKEKSVAIPKEYRALIRKACNATLKYEGFIDKAEINVTIVDDDEGVDVLLSLFIITALSLLLSLVVVVAVDNNSVVIFSVDVFLIKLFLLCLLLLLLLLPLLIVLLL